MFRRIISSLLFIIYVFLFFNARNLGDCRSVSFCKMEYCLSLMLTKLEEKTLIYNIMLTTNCIYYLQWYILI